MGSRGESLEGVSLSHGLEPKTQGIFLLRLVRGLMILRRNVRHVIRKAET